MEAISLSGSDRRDFTARPSLLLPIWKSYRRGCSVHARNPSRVGSCTKTFTTTLFALAINRNEIVPAASAQKYMPKGYRLRAQQLTAGARGRHLGNAGRSDQPAAPARTAKH